MTKDGTMKSCAVCPALDMIWPLLMAWVVLIAGDGLMEDAGALVLTADVHRRC